MTEMHKAALFLHVKIYHSCPMNMQKNKYVFKNFDTLNRNSTNRHDEDLLKLRREKIFPFINNNQKRLQYKKYQSLNLHPILPIWQKFN